MATCEETLNSINATVDGLSRSPLFTEVHYLVVNGDYPFKGTYSKEYYDYYEFLVELQKKQIDSSIILYKKMNSIQSDLSEIKTFLGID